MNNQNYQNSVTVIALIMMGFIVVVALIFRPEGAIQLRFGGNGPQLTIDEASNKSK